MTAPQNPASEQTGLPASRWSKRHTGSIVVFVLLMVLVAMSQWKNLQGTWVVLAVSLVALAAISGHGITGVWRGVFIDERNMISLSRLQMLAWTVVVLSAYGTAALARVHLDPSHALDVSIQPELWLLMGISTTSLVGSPLMKSTKKNPRLALSEEEVNATLENQREGLSQEVSAQGRIVSKKSVGDASWSDLFTGEEVQNVAHLDLAKIQMFFFTILLVLSYVVALWSLFAGECASADALTSAASGEPPAPDAPACVPSLPTLSEGAIALILISHGGYLVNKAVPANG